MSGKDDWLPFWTALFYLETINVEPHRFMSKASMSLSRCENGVQDQNRNATHASATFCSC